MKIGIILHPYGEKMPGGLPRIIFGWTQALLSVDQTNEYIVFVKEKPRVAPVFPGKNWRLEVLGNGRLWLDRLRKFPRADVYLFNTPVLPMFWKPPHSVVIALDYPYKYLPAKNWKTILFRKCISWYHARSLRRADAIIAVSESTKRDTVKFFGIAPEKISVVYHGYKDMSLVAEVPFTLPEKFFFFAGTMKERKNVLNIIKAYELLLRKHSDIQESLVLAGKCEGAYYDVLVKYIHDHMLGEKVVFTGHLNEHQISYAYARASALVFPSIVEGTGFPILEAMSARVPVITSAIFGPAELGGNGAAILVDPYTPEDIAQAMERIVFEPHIKEELASKAKEQLKQFSWDTTGKETLAILERAAHGTLSVCFVVHNVRPHNGGGVLARHVVAEISGQHHVETAIISAVSGGGMSEEALLSHRWFLSPRRLWRIIRMIRFSDIAYAFDVFPYGCIAALATVGSKTKLIITANGTGSIGYLYRPLVAPLAKFAFRRADRVVAISEFTKTEIIKKVPDLAITVIHPGIDLAVFGDEPTKELGVRPNTLKPYILGVGSLRYRKGYQKSLVAFKKISEQFPELRYVIVGKKYTDLEFTTLQNMVRDLGLVNKVIFETSVRTDAELAAYYHNAKLFMLNSLNVGHDVEGFGIVFLEAAAAGLPVIGSRGCGVEDAMSDGKNGFLVPENDADAIAAAAIKILNDETLYQTMARESRLFVKKFTWSVIGAEIIALVDGVL